LSLAAQLQRRAQAAGVPPEVGQLPISEAAGSSAAGSSAAGPSAAGPSAVGSDSRVPPMSPQLQQGAPDAADQGTATAGDSVSELGAELFALVARARAAGLNPELELRHAARVFRDRVQAWESGQGP